MVAVELCAEMEPLLSGVRGYTSEAFSFRFATVDGNEGRVEMFYTSGSWGRKNNRPAGL